MSSLLVGDRLDRWGALALAQQRYTDRLAFFKPAWVLKTTAGMLWRRVMSKRTVGPFLTDENGRPIIEMYAPATGQA